MYDVLIIGGGLAGLTCALDMARRGIKVALAEKQSYPFHRVCGEYVSNETLPYLERLGIQPHRHGAVSINELLISAPGGTALQMALESGGYGISRYRLDDLLYRTGLEAGVHFFLKTSVQRIDRLPNGWQCTVQDGTLLKARIVVGAHGKRSSIDKLMKRPFFTRRSAYIGVKHHIKTSLHNDRQIALHNFRDGYCGISRVEDDTYCLCYLTTRAQLKSHGNIAAMEAKLLAQNKYLKALWQEAVFLYEAPKVINEISFAPKQAVENGIFMCGDAAGLIAPLCGNGMAMAIHAAMLLAAELSKVIEGRQNLEEAEQKYLQQWQKLFGLRLRAGRSIQHLFGAPLLTDLFVDICKRSPWLATRLVRLTHGVPF